MMKETILENYSYLWRTEKAFRVLKTDLEIQAIFLRRNFDRSAYKSENVLALLS
ncbi:MAG: hypothetical protein M9887_09795 [Chitinophagales bacterium]|nr:hypothetical protein [Chitinophagales bacterium]